MKELSMADVLNQSWGGPGFASYDGKMESEDGPMDFEGRTDAALAAFSGDETDPAAGADPGADPAAGADPNADPGADPNADPNAGQLTDEQLEANPRFQELSTFRDEVTNALSEFPGLVDDKGVPNMEQAGLQLKDASVLYDIMQGRGTPSALLDIMAQNAGWSNEQKQGVANDLIQWLTKGGYLKDGATAAGAGKKVGDPGFKDPLADRLDKIENDRKTEAQRQEQQRVQAHQVEVFEKKFLPEVKTLCQQKQIPAEDVNDYIDRVAAMVKGNKAILGRIEKGNMVDVKKFFATVYNGEVKRLERWTKAQTAAADKKAKQTPRIPAGGATPGPAGSATKAAAKTRDERIAAAADML
jgi:hypothetical protein